MAWKSKRAQKKAAKAGGLARSKQPSFAEHNRRIAPLGARACIQKHGAALFVEKMRLYRLEHPSSTERAFMAFLEGRCNLAYEREVYTVGLFTSDFLLAPMAVVEVDGPVHDLFPTPKRAMQSAARLHLLQQAGWNVLNVHHTELDEPDQLAEKVLSFAYQHATTQPADSYDETLADIPF